MKINKKIIDKIADKTEYDEKLNDFLTGILMKEKEGVAQWKKEYNAKLNRILKD